MLTAETIATIKQTVPFLTQNGVELTTRFYARLFRENPELQPLFPAANQASGAQPRALAAAICAYAANIDRLEALSGAVGQIARKHVALKVRPEHYPIVGRHLLATIQEMLGEQATPAILQAWGEAYQLLAGILIGQESELYQQAAAPVA